MSWEIKKDLGLKDCIKIKVGKTNILLNEFKKSYNGEFGSDSIILETKKGYYSLGYVFRNKIVDDLKDMEIEVENLETFIKANIFEKLLEGLLYYVEENKESQFFNREDISLFYDINRIGTNPLTRIHEQIKFNVNLSCLEDDEIIIQYCGEKNLKFNIVNKNFYYDDEIFTSKEEQAKIILEQFCSTSNANEYVLYYKYINNLLKGEELGYKEIAELNKWLQKDNKVNISVIYEKDNEIKEDKIKNDINRMFSCLSKEYYEEMFSFYGVYGIDNIKQIKGFKYRQDFYEFNSNNLLYKKEGK